jgi:two-component system sensor histidine kinase PilS (NtrC family)
MSRLSETGRGASISAADLRNILRWLLLVRACLSTVIVLSGALLRPGFFSARSSLVLLLFLALAYVFTIYGYWRLRAERFGNARFLWLQLFHDLVFVTAVVAYTGGVDSPFTLLYIPLVAVASILFGMGGGVLFACGASVVYILLGVYQREFASILPWNAPYAPRLAPPGEPFLVNLLLLVALFFLIALVAAFLRDRLVTAGARVQELETEIRFITIDTRDILDSIESGVVSIDSRGELAFVNRKAMELLGIHVLAQEPRAIWREIAGRAPALARVLLETLDFRPAVSRGEIELDGEDGQVPLGITTNVLYDESGARRGVTAVFRDISGVKRMEQLSRQHERLSAVAELSASLAHEIKNPLASIRSSVELLSTDAPRSQDDARLFRLIVRESDRLSKLLTDFLHFSRMELREEVPIALRELIEEVVELHSLPAARPRAEIRVQWLGLREPVVEGDFDLLKQLFQNLLANAAQALDGRPDGSVTISVSRDYAANAERYALDPGRFVETRVADNGPGIQPQDLPRIFTPFFTTRPGGTGLGLAIVHRIVNVHGGAVFAESVPGSGTEFRVYLPLSTRAARPRTAGTAAGARGGRTAGVAPGPV